MNYAASQFHVTTAFDFSSEAFVIIGIFSKVEDAADFAAQAVQAGREGVSTHPMPIEAIKADLLAERLGVLHDTLLRLETAISGGQP